MKQRKTRYALFDLDDTMYPKSAGLMNIVSQRINEYIALRLGMEEARIKELRPRYWKRYGTTLRGLLVEHRIDPVDYLSYVHDFPVADLLAPNEELHEALGCLPWHKVIFTNASKRHAQQVLAALGVGEHFDRIFDIKDTGYVGKPDPSAYHCVLDSLGVGAADCLAIDDSIVNLRTAKELSMITVLVGSVEMANGVDFAIERIEEVAQMAC